MNRFFSFTMAFFLMSLLIIGCKKEDNGNEAPQPPAPPITEGLKFNPEKATVEIGKTTSVSIVGVWNTTDRVQIANGDVVAQQGEVSDNKITLLAKKIGTTQVNILNTEGRSRGSFEIEVTPVFELHFTPEKATVEVGKTTSVSIVGVWNTTDRVQIANGDVVAQQGEVSDNKITLLAKKIGTTQVNILNAEGRSRGSFEIEVTPTFQLQFNPEKAIVEVGKTTSVSIVGV